MAVVKNTAVWGELRADPAGGGLFFARESGLFRLDLATHAIDELDARRAFEPTDVHVQLSSLLDQDAWKGGKPRSLAWGEDRV